MEALLTCKLIDSDDEDVAFTTVATATTNKPIKQQSFTYTPDTVAPVVATSPVAINVALQQQLLQQPLQRPPDYEAVAVAAAPKPAAAPAAALPPTPVAAPAPPPVAKLPSSGSGNNNNNLSLPEQQKLKKERFVMFTRVLMKYLEQKNQPLHRRVKDIIHECAEKNKRKVAGYESVTAVMYARLKREVPEDTWKKATQLFEHILKQQQLKQQQVFLKQQQHKKEQQLKAAKEKQQQQQGRAGKTLQQQLQPLQPSQQLPSLLLPSSTENNSPSSNQSERFLAGEMSDEKQQKFVPTPQPRQVQQPQAQQNRPQQPQLQQQYQQQAQPACTSDVVAAPHHIPQARTTSISSTSQTQQPQPLCCRTITSSSSDVVSSKFQVGNSNNVFPGQEDALAAQRQHVIKQQQDRLLLLSHVSKCTLGEACTTKFCRPMVTLWKHMKRCRDRNCKYPHCYTSRCLLNHLRICKNEGRTSKCEVCGPLASLRAAVLTSSSKKPSQLEEKGSAARTSLSSAASPNATAEEERKQQQQQQLQQLQRQRQQQLQQMQRLQQQERGHYQPSLQQQQFQFNAEQQLLEASLSPQASTPQVETVDRNTHEFTIVCNLFHRTCPESQYFVMELKRITHPLRQFQQYLLKKSMDQRTDDGGIGSNAQWLFHGTKHETVTEIISNGFNRSFSNRGNFGYGIYFARDASYAAQRTYAKCDESGSQHMFLARVLLGQSTVGNSSYLTPPKLSSLSPGSGDGGGSSSRVYDSLTNNLENPSIFVSGHNDNQASPEYLIKFLYQNVQPNKTW